MTELWALIRFQTGGSIINGNHDSPVFCGIFSSLDKAKDAGLNDFKNFEFSHWVQWAKWKVFPCMMDNMSFFRIDDSSAVHIIDNEPRSK